jgi:uncharacterized protein YbjT (DUF2867 family)
MTGSALTVLVVGATGSIGRLVVDEALHAGHRVRALTRSDSGFPSGVEVVRADLTDVATLQDAVDGIDAVVFTHGTHGSGSGYRDVDYGGVRNVLLALDGRPVRIALMTAIGVTGRSYPSHEWKRRSERLVRASGDHYTIVRPGWFDYNDADQLRLDLLQGDTRHAGNSSDGVIARRQIAQVLVGALIDDAAARKTFELVAEHGPAQIDLTPVFAELDPDPTDGIDGVHDAPNLPFDDEPTEVRQDLEAVRSQRSA